MQETKGGRLLVGKIGPVGPCGIEHLEGPEHVRLDEGLGALDRAVHVAFGCQVQDCAGAVGSEDLLDRRAIGDVGLHEVEALVLGAIREALEVSRVGELVDHDHPGLALREGQAHEVAADEARASRDQPGLHGQT